MSDPVRLRYPFRGRWLVRNSPADRVPSHGTHVFGTTYAVDFLAVDERGRSAAIRPSSLLRPEAPERFPGFNRPVLSPTAGIVVAAHDGEVDHEAYRGLPSVGYALTQRSRANAGWKALAGNHVVIQTQPGVFVALCHFRNGSLAVTTGQGVDVGDRLARCGNSGNSTEPHVHVQAIDRLDISRAFGLPIAFPDGMPSAGSVIDAPHPR